MNDELRKAAERVKRYESLSNVDGPIEVIFDAHNEALQTVYGDERSRRNLSGDRTLLARAYLAEHPADDGEPVDDELLKAVLDTRDNVRRIAISLGITLKESA